LTGRVSAVANILVADDTVENLRLLVNMLGGQGYEVRPVTGGARAIAAAERDPPDLILLDINMPDMNGYEVCAELKRRPALASIPVIFLTALSEVADKVRAFDVGGVDYITKPFQLEEVQVRVRTHLELRTARRELSENLDKLRALELLRDDLVHMIVHDMRSPLMTLIGHLGFLQKDALTALPKESLRDLEAAVHAAKVVAHMANDLLDVSRLENSRIPLERHEHDLSALSRAVVGTLGTLDPRRVIELVAPEPVHIAYDAELIRRVLENLIGNAVKHTPSSGRVFVSASATPDGARVTVSDEGNGIPEQAKQRIFEKFGTVATRRDQQYHSVGLGLAFCKLAVSAHAGNIGVTSREPRGSTFWFELPR
jgi:two-component system sensor histidine kinase/response regulator